MLMLGGEERRLLLRGDVGRWGAEVWRAAGLKLRERFCVRRCCGTGVGAGGARREPRTSCPTRARSRLRELLQQDRAVSVKVRQEPSRSAEGRFVDVRLEPQPVAFAPVQFAAIDLEPRGGLRGRAAAAGPAVPGAGMGSAGSGVAAADAGAGPGPGSAAGGGGGSGGGPERLRSGVRAGGRVERVGYVAWGWGRRRRAFTASEIPAHPARVPSQLRVRGGLRRGRGGRGGGGRAGAAGASNLSPTQPYSLALVCRCPSMGWGLQRAVLRRALD
jgi:hypothetical protein